MSNETIEDGTVRYESNFAKLDSHTVTFDSETVRQFMRSSPDKVGNLAFSFVTKCCGELGDNKEERDLYLSHALSQLERHLKKMKR